MAQLGNFLLSHFSYFFLFKKFCLFIPKVIQVQRVEFCRLWGSRWEVTGFEPGNIALLYWLSSFISFRFFLLRNVICCIPFRYVAFRFVVFWFLVVRFVPFHLILLRLLLFRCVLFHSIEFRFVPPTYSFWTSSSSPFSTLSPIHSLFPSCPFLSLC